MGLQGGKGVPFEYISMQLMEKFHWTIQELNSQPWEQIELFIGMMNMESEYEKKKNRLAEQRTKQKRFPG